MPIITDNGTEYTVSRYGGPIRAKGCKLRWPNGDPVICHLSHRRGCVTQDAFERQLALYFRAWKQDGDKHFNTCSASPA